MATISPSGDLADHAARLRTIRDKVQRVAVEAGREDLVPLLDDSRLESSGGPARIVVAGETNRGKSSLINALLARALLSPVGADVTTSCWVEFSYGTQDEATVFLATQDAAVPRGKPIGLHEVEQYVSLDEVSSPVLGVEIRVPAGLLRHVTLVDTPGVGGLVVGHARTTLTALKNADALLFVCDSTQPILAPEVEFLIEATARVSTIAVTIAKSDNPGAEDVVAETVARLATRPELRDRPIYSVSARLAELATEAADPVRAARLANLAGMEELTTALTGQMAAETARTRIVGVAKTTVAVARQLAQNAGKAATDLAAARERQQVLQSEIHRLTEALDDQPGLIALVEHKLALLEGRPRDRFDSTVATIRERYAGEAERAPSAQLKTLAVRMVEDITAASITSLEGATEDAITLVRDLMRDLNAEEEFADIPLRDPRNLNLQLGEPPPPNGPLALQTVAELMSAAVGVSVVTGVGAVAAGIALAAGTGWWLIRASNEQQRRSDLRAWVVRSATESRPAFAKELQDRVSTVRRYVAAVLPVQLAAHRRKLQRLEAELAAFSQADAQSRHATKARVAGLENHLTQLAQDATELLTDIESRGAVQ